MRPSAAGDARTLRRRRHGHRGDTKQDDLLNVTDRIAALDLQASVSVCNQATERHIRKRVAFEGFVALLAVTGMASCYQRQRPSDLVTSCLHSPSPREKELLEP